MQQLSHGVFVDSLGRVVGLLHLQMPEKEGRKLLAVDAGLQQKGQQRAALDLGLEAESSHQKQYVHDEGVVVFLPQSGHSVLANAAVSKAGAQQQKGLVQTHVVVAIDQQRMGIRAEVSKEADEVRFVGQIAAVDEGQQKVLDGVAVVHLVLLLALGHIGRERASSVAFAQGFVEFSAIDKAARNGVDFGPALHLHKIHRVDTVDLDEMRTAVTSTLSLSLYLVIVADAGADDLRPHIAHVQRLQIALFQLPVRVGRVPHHLGRIQSSTASPSLQIRQHNHAVVLVGSVDKARRCDRPHPSKKARVQQNAAQLHSFRPTDSPLSRKGLKKKPLQNQGKRESTKSDLDHVTGSKDSFIHVSFDFHRLSLYRALEDTRQFFGKSTKGFALHAVAGGMMQFLGLVQHR